MIKFLTFDFFIINKQNFDLFYGIHMIEIEVMVCKGIFFDTGKGILVLLKCSIISVFVV